MKTFQPGSVKVVMAGSGCENREKVEQVQYKCMPLSVCVFLVLREY